MIIKWQVTIYSYAQNFSLSELSIVESVIFIVIGLYGERKKKRHLDAFAFELLW